MPGLRGLAVLTVTDADTAVALRSGEVPTLATPRLVALLEEATVSALDGCLGKGETSVGMRVHIDHLAPSAPGSLVDAEVVLEAVAGRRLTFGGTAQTRHVRHTRLVEHPNLFQRKGRPDNSL